MVAGILPVDVIEKELKNRVTSLSLRALVEGNAAISM